MKNFLLGVLTIGFVVLLTCTILLGMRVKELRDKPPKLTQPQYDDTALQDRIAELEERIEALEKEKEEESSGSFIK